MLDKYREMTFEARDRIAISHEAMILDIERACADVNRDPGISCLVITGAGTVFSAGGNVKDMVDRAGMFGGSPVEVFRGYRYGIQRIPLAVDAVEVPTICAVNGPAIGAGCDLAFMCDLRIASDQARFGETFVNLGIVPGRRGRLLPASSRGGAEGRGNDVHRPRDSRPGSPRGWSRTESRISR